jgi:hypothetical protein
MAWRAAVSQVSVGQKTCERELGQHCQRDKEQQQQHQRKAYAMQKRAPEICLLAAFLYLCRCGLQNLV